MGQASAQFMQREADCRAPSPARVRAPTGLSVSALAAVIALVAILTGCGSSSIDDSPTQPVTSSSGPAPPSFFGVVSQAPLASSDYEQMAKAGVKTLRAPLYWQQAQPEEGGQVNFSDFDQIVAAAAKQGITVFPFLYGTPDWIAQGLDHYDCSDDCQLYAPHGKQALTAWSLFAGAAEARYGPGGLFWKENPDIPELPIRAWQVWNEQNSRTYYQPKPDPAAYEPLLASTTRVIKAQDKGASIVLGGMFGTPAGGKSKNSIPAATFLHGLLQIDGAKDEFDGFALHPYSGSVDFVRKQVEISRREMTRSGDPGASLWISEVGWASGGEKTPVNAGSEKAQAQRVSQVYRMFEQHREEWNVKLVAWFAWQDVATADANCFFCARAGLTDVNGNPKPSLDAYSKVTGSG